eukprot:scaffold1960_cov242-Pinguiococcus_pyrenoidosus.AAC.8
MESLDSLPLDSNAFGSMGLQKLKSEPSRLRNEVCDLCEVPFFFGIRSLFCRATASFLSSSFWKLHAAKV